MQSREYLHLTQTVAKTYKKKILSKFSSNSANKITNQSNRIKQFLQNSFQFSFYPIVQFIPSASMQQSKLKVLEIIKSIESTKLITLTVKAKDIIKQIAQSLKIKLQDSYLELLQCLAVQLKKIYKQDLLLLFYITNIDEMEQNEFNTIISTFNKLHFEYDVNCATIFLRSSHLQWNFSLMDIKFTNLLSVQIDQQTDEIKSALRNIVLSKEWPFIISLRNMKQLAAEVKHYHISIQELARKVQLIIGESLHKSPLLVYINCCIGEKQVNLEKKFNIIQNFFNKQNLSKSQACEQKFFTDQKFQQANQEIKEMLIIILEEKVRFVNLIEQIVDLLENSIDNAQQTDIDLALAFFERPVQFFEQTINRYGQFLFQFTQLLEANNMSHFVEQLEKKLADVKDLKSQPKPQKSQRINSIMKRAISSQMSQKSQGQISMRQMIYDISPKALRAIMKSWLKRVFNFLFNEGQQRCFTVPKIERETGDDLDLVECYLNDIKQADPIFFTALNQGNQLNQINIGRVSKKYLLNFEGEEEKGLQKIAVQFKQLKRVGIIKSSQVKILKQKSPSQSQQDEVDQEMSEATESCHSDRSKDNVEIKEKLRIYKQQHAFQDFKK